MSILGLMMLVLSGHETLMQQSVMCPPLVPSVPRLVLLIGEVVQSRRRLLALLHLRIY